MGQSAQVKEVNANNALLLKTVLSYYGKKQQRIARDKKDEKQILQIYQQIQNNGQEVRVQDVLGFFKHLKKCSKHLLDRILLAFHKNPQKENERMSYQTFLRFYKVIVSQQAN